MNPTSEPIQIRSAESQSDRDAIARLRYEVYVEEMGRLQDHADHVGRLVHEPMDHGSVLIGAFTPDGRAGGTLRVNAAEHAAIPCRELYGWEQRTARQPGRVCLGSKFIIGPAHRSSTLAFKILRLAVHEVLQRDWRFCFVDANQHLVELYQRMGFVPTASREHPVYGPVTILEWDLHDLDHQRRIGSPMLRACAAELACQAQAA